MKKILGCLMILALVFTLCFRSDSRSEKIVKETSLGTLGPDPDPDKDPIIPLCIFLD